MSYRAGTNGLQAIGIPNGEPRIICDGCGLERSVTLKSGIPASWFLDNRAAPKWKLVRTEEPFRREDYCPRCKESHK